MRPDMMRLLVERGRVGGWSASNGGRKELQKTPPEEWRSRERLKDRWDGGSKYPIDRLAPLRRFLRSNVGRPWDLVYSEIRREIRERGKDRGRLLVPVDRYVERGAILVDGVPCHGPGHAHGTPLRNHAGWYFYVCPRTGLLRRVPDRPKQRR